MKNKKQILVFFYFFLILNIVWGQNQSVNFSHLTVNNGLSQSWIKTVYQDHIGFLWIGTDDGLNRYDGYNFNIYKHDLRQMNSILSNTIYCILEDKYKNLWIGTLEGLNLYDRINDNFIHKKDWPEVRISSFAADKKDKIWFGAESGLFCMDLKTNLPTKALAESPEDKNILNLPVDKVYIDSKERIWFINSSGLYIYSSSTKSVFTVFRIEDKIEGTKISRFYDVLEDTRGKIWLGTQQGLKLFPNNYKLGASDKKVVSIDLDNDKENTEVVSFLFEDHAKQLWVGTEHDGVFQQKLKNLANNNFIFNHFTNDPDNANSLNNNTINYIYQDNQENLWIGTFGNGLNIIKSISYKFEHTLNELNKKNSLKNNQVNAFLDDGKYLWVGTEGGLHRYDKQNKTFKHFIHRPSDKGSIGSNAVWAICKDKRGNLWIGTWAGGLNLYHEKTGTFSHYYNSENPNSIGSNNIFSILEDSRSDLWIGTMGGGLNLFDRDKGIFIRYTTQNTNLQGNFIEQIIETKRGDLWLANIDYLVKFNRSSGSCTVFHQLPSDNKSLSSSRVYTVFEDSKENLWVGTQTGLNLFDYKTKTFSSYQITQGLPDNSIKSINEDNNGNLWLGTNKGIAVFFRVTRIPDKPVFRNYTIEDGIQSNEFNRRSTLKTSDGTLYFGGVNGYNIIHPDKIKYNPYVPKVIIVGFLIFNEHVPIGAEGSPLKKNISLTNDLKLKYNQSVFSFQFAALNFISPEKNQYAYKMEGFEDKWNYVGNKREATYTNLNPGKYVFRVIASNNDGLWNEEGTFINITILPPWWLTIWFKIIFIIFLGCTLVLLYYLRISNYRKKEKELTILVKQRTLDLEQTNNLLVERQIRIEEQANELMTQTENLRRSNDLLIQNQKYIQEQSKTLEETNQQLSILNVTKDKFFSIIAHDLRNPFHTVMGFAELLLSKFEHIPPDKVKRYLQHILTSSSNGNALLDNLLHWSRSQTGTITFEPEAIDLSDIIKNSFKLFDSEANRKNLNLINNVEPGTFVFADMNMIMTVFRNLISNAIKFSNSNGYIAVSAVHQVSLIEITIKDNGVGIDPNKLNQLFNINTNFSTKGTSHEQGTGLGLILCKEFVERHGGKIWVESNLSEGSEFKFTMTLN